MQHHNARHFLTTSWTVVREAAGDSEKSEAALEELCRLYWSPLYTFVARRIGDLHAAQDLTQEFLSGFLQSNSLQSAHPNQGKFRTYLLASLKNYLAKDWRDSKRIKRGGSFQFISWEELNIEAEHMTGMETSVEPELAYDRKWAMVVLSRAVNALEAEMASQDMLERFQILKPHLQGGGSVQSYSTLATLLNISEGGVKTLVFRMRRRLGELIRHEISKTVQNDTEVEEEIRYLISTLSESTL